MTPKEQAEKLLPCEDECDPKEGLHIAFCPHSYRADVAEALAAKDDEIERLTEHLRLLQKMTLDEDKDW